LLTRSQCDCIDIVLVSPRNPLNIGAVARAMANFGFSRLAVVAPYAPHWREARSAIGAPGLLQNATETESLAEAVASSTFVAGTGTLANRNPRQPSMNLGQAVAVCLYELARRPQPDSSAPGTVGSFTPAPIRQEKSERMGRETSEIGPASSSGALDRLAGLIEETMTAAGYSPRVMQPANRHDLRLLLRRLAPSALDTRRMLGLFRRILYRLKRSADPRSG
jgi:tRNA C32,U32 (ribose-2'-O)-methylase TrmJ